jgi:hypothetical protein
MRRTRAVSFASLYLEQGMEQATTHYDHSLLLMNIPANPKD